MNNFEKSPLVTGSEYVEPFSGSLYDKPYGSMPANPFLNEEVKDRQDNIDVQLSKLFEFPPPEQNIPDEFRDFLLDDHNMGEVRRKMQNFESYSKWHEKLSQLALPPYRLALPSYLLEQQARFEAGRAETDDVLDIMVDPINDDKETALLSGEIGKITHPYWQRIEHLPEFRKSVAESIESHGGVLYPPILPYRSIDIVPKTTIDGSGRDRIVGFIVKYKHDIGEIVSPGSGRVVRIVERQLAGYRVDAESGFRQDVIDAMHKISDLRGDKFSWENVHSEKFEYQLRETGCRGFIEKAIQTDSTKPFVVPISTTIYGYNEFLRPDKKPTGEAASYTPRSDLGIPYSGPNYT